MAGSPRAGEFREIALQQLFSCGSLLFQAVGPLGLDFFICYTRQRAEKRACPSDVQGVSRFFKEWGRRVAWAGGN